MNAAAQRAAWAEVGSDIIAARGTIGERRAAGLRPIATLPPVQFERLSEIPRWLRWSSARQSALGQAVSVRVLAQNLAASIDGAWLGSIARVVGEDMLDWGIALGAAPGGSEHSGPIPAPEQMASAGLATLRTTLPEDLRGYVAVEPTVEPMTAEPALIADALAFVEGRPA